jgi:hypothetical protein
MTARPWVFGLADLAVGLPLRVSAGLGPDFPHGRAIRLSGELSFLVGAGAVKRRHSEPEDPEPGQRGGAEPVQQGCRVVVHGLRAAELADADPAREQGHARQVR